MYKTKCLMVLTFITLINCGSVPVISKCSKSDSKCITKSGNAIIAQFARGIPEYGVSPLDPLYIKEIDLSTPNLKLKGTDLKMTGLKDSVIKSTKIDKEKSTMVTKIEVNTKIECNYEMDGKLLFIPLKGKGPFHANIRKLDLVITSLLKEVVGDDGKTHWQLVFDEFKYTLKDKSEIVFDNLLEDNKILADTAKEVIATSGNEIIEEVGYSLIKEITLAVVKEINNFFKFFSVSELTSD